MQTVIKKTILSTLIFALVSGFSFSASAVSTDYTPTVKVKKIKDTYATLTVTSTNLKSKDVKIKVKIENVDADSDDTKIFEKKLSRAGKADIKIDGLTKDNAYSFEVAVKKSSEGNYSNYSEEIKINAEGVSDYDPTLSIKDETSSTVVLEIASTKLKKKKSTVKVWIRNEDTDKTEIRTFSKTLNKNGKTEITIDGLSKDTEYKFKASVKKSNDKGFSGYSGEKSTTTED